MKMNVAMQSVLALWLCTFTLVRGCTKAELVKMIGETKGLLTTQLQELYPDNAVVRVPCDVGQEGYFRAQCLNDKWVPRASNTACKLKSCGHPGDSSFADFTLEEGNVFVFGSTVKYECQKGYVMVTRTSTRKCFDKGWSNTVPVCEAIQCPVIEVDDNIDVNGNYEEATYGNVIQFQCKFNNMIIQGSTDMYCGDQGHWVGTKPKCKEIECEIPLIKYGFVNGNHTYKENDILHYNCDTRFRPSSARKPKCIKKGIDKAGWNLTPECEQITCELPSLARGTTYLYEPTKTRFLPDDSLEVKCNEGYWTFNSHQDFKTVKCQDNGEWGDEGTASGRSALWCEAIRCNRPNDKFISFGIQRSWKNGETFTFPCKLGYRQANKNAKCTKNGWIPTPRCEEITCDLPSQAKGTTYQYEPTKTRFLPDDSLEVKCNEGYWTFNSHQDFKTVKCKDNGEWGDEGTASGRSALLCEAIHCNRPNDKFISFGIQRSWKNGEAFTFPCKLGYRQANINTKCTKNGWIPTPRCEEMTCPQPDIPNAVNLYGSKSTYKFNDKLTYKCPIQFEPMENTITCKNGWENIKQCKAIQGRCTIENGVVLMSHKVIENGVVLRSDKVIHYSCNEGYKPFTKKGWWGEAVCGSGGLPRHLKCIGKSTCRQLPEITNAVEPPKDGYSDNVPFKCKDGYISEKKKIICEKGEWKDIPTCILSSQMCTAPDRIENAVIRTQYQKEYMNGSQITYECRKSFHMSEESSITCKNGTWLGELPKCIEREESGLHAEAISRLPPGTEESGLHGEAISRLPPGTEKSGLHVEAISRLPPGTEQSGLHVEDISRLPPGTEQSGLHGEDTMQRNKPSSA